MVEIMCTELKLKQITVEISKNLRDILGNRLHNIILYGSYARGDYDTESDIDIMAIADIESDEKNTLQKAIDRVSSSISLKNDITVSILLKDRCFFDAHTNISPFYKNIVSEGIKVYGNE
jgi:predicted nucleotidyltransferase